MLCPTLQVGTLPVVDQLVVGDGVHGLVFQNIAFQHATWMGASGPYGFVDVQGGWTLHCQYLTIAHLPLYNAKHVAYVHVYV